MEPILEPSSTPSYSARRTETRGTDIVQSGEVAQAVDIARPHRYSGPDGGTCTLTLDYAGRAIAMCGDAADAPIHQDWPADETPHKYLGSYTDPRCFQSLATGPYTSDVCEEGPESPRHAVGGHLHLPVERMSVDNVLRNWRPGSGLTWIAETADLYFRDGDAMVNLEDSIRAHGLRAAVDGEDPICLGSDGRIWEGHHRLLAAYIVDDMLRLPEDAYMGHEAPLTEGVNRG